MIRAIRSKSGQNAVCDEVLTLIDTIPDPYKALIPYDVGAIELTFDIVDAFAIVSNQAGVARREQMRGAQFAAFFGQHRAFVHAATTRNRHMLGGYNTEMDSQIRSVLDSTDWTKVRPLKAKTTGPPRGDRPAQLRRLIAQLRPRYPSENAMLEALPAHQDSLKNALAGKGKPSVLGDILRKAQRLAEKLQVVPSARAAPRPSAENSVAVKDPVSFVGSLISSLNSFVRMGEAVGIDPQTFTDGHRDNLIRIMIKLAALARIDDAAIKRLQSVEGLATDDPSLKAVVSALRGGK